MARYKCMTCYKEIGVKLRRPTQSRKENNMATIILTQEEYKRKMFEAYKEGFQAAIEALKYSLAAIDEIRPTLRTADMFDQ